MKRLNYKQLNLSKEKEKELRNVINGKADLESYDSVKKRIAECYNRPMYSELQMTAINEILEGYGIEGMQGEWQNGSWCHIVFEYVNMGDTYTPTVILHRDKGFIITSWGDYVEKYGEKEGIV